MQAEQELIKEDLVIDSQTLIIMSYFDCLPALQNIKRLHISFGSVSSVQYCYLSWDHPCIKNLMRWIESACNIIFEADGFIDNENIFVKAFSRDFIAGCNIAKEQGFPFLTSEGASSLYQAVMEDDVLKDIDFVSIPAVCNFCGKTQPSVANRMLYQLLTGCTFISFSAETILEQIESHNYCVSLDLMRPFLICKSDYDMRSFSNVYLQAIYRLHETHLEAAISLARIILNDAVRIWRRGAYYRETATKLVDADIHKRLLEIDIYVAQIVDGIIRILPNMPEDLSVLCTELRQLVLDEE